MNELTMKAASRIASVIHLGLKISQRSGTCSIGGSASGRRIPLRIFTTGCYPYQQQQQQRQRYQHPLESDVRISGPAAAILRGAIDRYKGVHISLDQLPASCSTSHFASIIKESLGAWSKSNRSSVWMSVPIEKSHFIPEAAKFGFRFHHAENSSSVLCLWLSKDTNSMLPISATHQVGVAGCVVHSVTNQVLVIKDKMQAHPLWKFPGGLSNLSEDIDDTAKREVWEETGLRTKFRGVLAFRQQHEHPDAFGRSDLFYVCLMTPMTFDLKPCNVEIAVCKWMSIADLEQSNMISAISKRCLQLVRYGLKHGFERVTIGEEECDSIYKGKRMKLFARNLDTKRENFDLGDYPHHITTGDQFD